MIIKICGVTSLAIAKAAEANGADFIGLVFADSRRRVDLATAQLITAATTIGKIGVFANAPLSEVQTIARKLKLNYVQLHGNESEQYCQALGLPVIKAFPPTVFNAVRLNSFPADWILLDYCGDGQFGGAGRTFDWHSLQAERLKLTKPLFIAGGLNSGNVKQAMQILRPDGVDVSSGVETNGRKCPGKIGDFIKTVREELGDA